MTPMQRALDRSKKKKSCPTCEDRKVIDGISYCGISQKIIHPVLLHPGNTAGCPHEDGRRI